MDVEPSSPDFSDTTPLYERRLSNTGDGLALDARALIPAVPPPVAGSPRTPQAQRELDFMHRCQQAADSKGGVYHRTFEDYGLTLQERQWLTELYNVYRDDATSMEALLTLLRTIEHANTDQEQLLQDLGDQFDLHVMNGVAPLLSLEHLFAYSARAKERPFSRTE